MVLSMSESFQTGLGIFYALCVLMNLGFAWYYWRYEKNIKAALGWSFVAEVFLLHAIGYLFHLGWEMPQGLRDFINSLAGAVTVTTLSVVLFCAFLYWRKAWTNPHVAWGILNFSFLFAGWGLTDPSFRSNLTKPDNVPIPLLIYSVGFFTWLAMRRAVINDERMDRGEPPLEKLEDEKVLVWPDLVYTELIAMVICTVLLIVWGIVLKAPLEQPATSAKAPNPSKAPWYFLGLQEMLVYFDPWMAGVVLPTFIIIGLIAIPYIDYNQKGNGYFTFVQRKFAVTTFLYGFIVLWVVLIVLGTFLRGPNWNFFGPFEYWDPHKVLPLNNINVSDIVWLKLLDTSPSTVTFPGYKGSQLLNVL